MTIHWLFTGGMIYASTRGPYDKRNRGRAFSVARADWIGSGVSARGEPVRCCSWPSSDGRLRR